jgi:hypothetical protein
LRIVLQGIVCLGILGAGIIAQSQPAPLSAANPKNALGAKNTVATPTATLRATPSPTQIADLQKIGTPTPVRKFPSSSLQSPVVIGREPRVLPKDGNTVALFHFDTRVGNETFDATGNYTGTMVNNVSIVPGLFDNALTGDGWRGSGSYVRAGPIDWLRQGTIEAYVDFVNACTGVNGAFTIVSIGGDFGSGIQGARLTEDTDRLNFELLAADGWHVASSAINACRYLVTKSAEVWPYETWRFHHVAGTWGPRGMEIWVDGVLHGITHPDYFNQVYLNEDYVCNPQKQLGMDPYPPNPHYPYCPSPRQGNVGYRGVYTDGLPANTTLIIGCDPNGNRDNCFSGRIDDLRISDIQRTYTVGIVPPSSPTPTQTPDQISGEYTVDTYTLALYHMNSLNAQGGIPDATGQHDAGLRGVATLESQGRYNGSLWVNGNNSFAFGRNLNSRYGTVETWIKLDDSFSPFSALSIGAAPGEGYYYYLTLGMPYRNGTLQFGINDNTQMHWADSGMAVSTLAGCWHHVAGTWGPRGVEIWVDGVKRGTNGYTGQLFADGLFVMGCNAHSECMIGYLDEVRFGNVQRSFTPPLRPAPVSAPTRLNAPAAGDFSIFFPFVGVVPPPVCPYG